MKAEELRLNNWVLSLGKDGIWYNSKISKIEVQNIIVGVGFKRKLKPIPLSEDILLKCGFEKILTFNEWRRNKILKHEHFNFPLYEHEKINMYLYPFFGGNFLFYNGCTMNVSHIPYLHQLQNLYYAITGKELEINL